MQFETEVDGESVQEPGPFEDVQDPQPETSAILDTHHAPLAKAETASESAIETPAMPERISHPAPAPVSNERLTNHLRRYEVQIDPDAAAEMERSEVSGHLATTLHLPATLKESLSLLAATSAGTPRDKFEIKIKAAKLEKLRAHIHALSQGPPIVPVDPISFHKRSPSPAALDRIAKCYPMPKPKRA